ncbi:hypothetical protein SLEP1_g41660 [Rubroshorea leprosula]|uniref:Uncharacterized protein n=1 Tax=Rubroshorea leprosula TaxID=152421 RepID=A0AAV5L8K6_9ROSI|nr:hypothetical protein SLEP1_g41660 [Rubroshorea leprosula]
MQLFVFFYNNLGKQATTDIFKFLCQIFDGKEEEQE